MATCVALASILSASILPAAAAEGDPQAVPKLTKRVMDLTASLSASEAAAIEARIRDFETKKGAQIAVLIVTTVQPETVFDYSSRVFTEWKLGRKGVDDGVLFVIAKNDRKMQILTGPGLSGSLTDAIAKRIIAETVAPKFRANEFAGGIDAGTQKIMTVIDGEALPPPPARRQASQPQGMDFGTVAMIAFFVSIGVGGALTGIFGRLIGSTMSGGITGVLAWLFIGGVLATTVFAVGGGLLALMGSGMRGGGGRGVSRGGGWTTGGWSSGGGSWGGGSSGGSSDGGFSGGGGSFDGGGASGDW
jgi:uncharacterized protein